jgi:hypothetical protein
MGLHQDFRFTYESPAQVQRFLRALSGVAKVEDRGEFFVFTQQSGPAFSFDCELLPFGLRTNRGGEYFLFLGQFVEALTGEFGAVEVEDL